MEELVLEDKKDEEKLPEQFEEMTSLSSSKQTMEDSSCLSMFEQEKSKPKGEYAILNFLEAMKKSQSCFKVAN